MPDTTSGAAPEVHDFAPFQLMERIRRGECVLLLGPGVAIDPSKPAGPPLASALAQRLASDPEVLKTGAVGARELRNLRYAAELFARVHDREDLERVAAGVYDAFGSSTTDFHRDIAALPFALCINTSPDQMMANAFQAAGKRPRVAHYSFRRQLPDAPPGKAAEPLVYHLYGRSADAESLVLTESDLVDFLVGVVKNEPPLPAWMRGLLGKKRTEFLFVGFGFQNWHLRVLLHGLGMMDVHERPSYALEDPSFFQHPECQQTVGYFRRAGGGIKFQQVAWNEFAAQLRASFEAESTAQPVRAPPADAPLAFLSYASEDEAATTALGAGLEARGIRVWQDRDRLRGGDRWEQALKHVVGKEAQYFVVVQSATMTAREEGVFFAEIRWALDRQTRMPDGRRFVIPVTADGRTLQSLRDQFHVISVATEAGVDQLAQAIREDWSARRAARDAA